MNTYFFDPELRRSIERLLLPDIRLPGQYIGGELGQIVKPAESVRARIAFCFPDVYSIGMSNVALSVLYDVVNKRPDLACERVFCPYPDMEALLRSNGLPLYSLETFSPLASFDVLGFTLQYELCYSSVLTTLDLGGVPILRRDRRFEDPLVVAGGPAACNPEPTADFIDVFLLGDGEETLPELLEFWADLRDRLGVKRAFSAQRGVVDRERSAYRRSENFSDDESDARRSRALRRDALLEIARKFPCAYVPEFYEVSFDETGRARRPRPTEPGVPEYVRSAAVRNLDDFPPPTRPLIPTIESVQDRVSVEIMRGCPQKCRFCQSTQLKRPLRRRSVNQIIEAITAACANTGVDESTLLSLSSSDYPKFEETLQTIQNAVCPKGISLSVPSLRVNHQLSSVVQGLSTDRSSSLTVAPEAARDEMRRRVAKQVTNEDLFAGCRSAFENGFSRVKMYFMCGFPEETEADLTGIIELSNEICRLGKETRGKYAQVVANVSNFVPKPHTPLQWAPMKSREYFEDAHRLLRQTHRERSVDLKYHELSVSLLEGLLSRGDRRIGRVVEAAWRAGARLDPWREYFRPDLWDAALESSGLDADRLVRAPYSLDSELPWDHILVYNDKETLKNEFELSKQGKIFNRD